MNRIRSLLLWSFGAVLVLSTAYSFGQPAYIYGIHDDSSNVSEWTSHCPSGQSWITATEEIGSNPADTNGKTYNPPSGCKILGRLNNGYFPNGTIPLPAKYQDFATRCANFASASSNCDTWIIGNETNVTTECPNDGGYNLVYISPENYADCYKKCYAAIKAVRPAHKVIVQALGPWGGPYGSSVKDGYNVPAMPENWVDYYYKMVTAITTGTGAVTPDGFALHINSRGWTSGALADGPWIETNNLTLDFSWGVRRDWIQFGIPRNLWNLPLYATECNGLYYWKGGGPATPSDPSYATGWIQQVYSDVNSWNQNAKNFSMPIYRCVNMYRWCSWCDGWNIDGSPQEGTILSDLSSAAGNNYTWPSYGGNALNVGTPSGMPYSTGITATADTEFSSSYTAAKAFDGDVNTKWCSTNASKVHWLVADLGAAKTINGYIVRHASSAGDSATFNTTGFYIQIGASATGPWTLHTMVRTNTPGVQPSASTALVYNTPVTARYVRLYVNSPSYADADDYARIQEFEIVGPVPGTETIIDNLDAGFSKVSGTWTDSSGSPGYYGTNYAYAVTVTGSATAVARWTPTGLSGSKEVFVWYVAGSNRPTDAQFLVTHTGGTATVSVNQTINGSQWVSLGTYTLDANSKVELTNLSATSGKAAIADAVRFLGAAPTPTPSLTPTPSPSPSLSPTPTPSLTPSPTPTVTPVPTDIVVDNPAASFSGSWSTGTSSTDKYGSDYRFAYSGSGATATYNASLPQAGNYRVSVWYPAGTNRANNAPYTVNFDSGSLTYSVNQQAGGGAWNVLGTFYFAAGGGQVVIGTAGANPSVVMADAVRFEFLSATAPTTVTFDSVAADDGYVLESGENTSVGGSNNSANTVFAVGDYSDRRQFVGIASFDTSPIPDGATIQKVTLKLTRYSINGTNPWTSLGTCTVDIKAVYFGTAATLENADFESAADASSVATVPDPGANNVTVSAPLSSAGVFATSKTAKTQLKIRFTIDDDNDSANDYINFYSGDYSSNTTYRPKLEIQYTQ